MIGITQKLSRFHSGDRNQTCRFETFHYCQLDHQQDEAPANTATTLNSGFWPKLDLISFQQFQLRLKAIIEKKVGYIELARFICSR